MRLVLVPNLGGTITGVALETGGIAVGEPQPLTSTAEVLGGLPTTRWDGLTTTPSTFKVKIAGTQIPDGHQEAYQIEGITYYRFKAGSVRDLLVIVHFSI